MSKIFEAVTAAIGRGWNVFPIKCYIDQEGKEKKAPPYKFKWKQYQRARVEMTDLLNWQDKKLLRDQDAYGYAVLAGEISNLFVVDTDNQEATNTILGLLDGVETHTVATPRGGRHFYFKHVDGFENYVNIGVAGIDIRTSGGYVVGPGSISCGGIQYETIIDSDVELIPTKLLEFLVKHQVERGSKSSASGSGKKTDWFTRVQEDGWEQGERMDMLKKTVGMLIRQNMQPEMIRVVCRSINDRSPVSLKDGELESQMTSMINRFASTHDDDVSGYGDLQEEIFALNEQYAQITLGGKPMVMRFDESDYEFIQPGAFNMETKHLMTFIKNKKNYLSSLWSESAYRRRYKGIVFNPSKEKADSYEDGYNGSYNLWEGFKYKPKKGDWSMFRKHLIEIMAPGHGDYVLKWIARMFQDPGGQRPGKVLVFRGKSGCGKSFSRRMIGNCFGKHYFKTDRIDLLIGKFNTAVAHVVFLALEEAMWAGDKSAVGRLKERITSNTMTIEKKGVDIITVSSHVNIWMNSNEEWVVPVQDNDRRFVMFDVKDTYMGNHDYFFTMEEQMENGGYEAMMYDLMNMEVSRKELMESPKTLALTDQMDRTGSPVKQFARYCLERGQLHPMHKGWKQVILVEKLEDSYRIWCDKMRIQHRGFNFKKDIVQYLVDSKGRKRFGGHVKGVGHQALPVYNIGTLDDARARFDPSVPREWDTPEVVQTYKEEDAKQDLLESYLVYGESLF